MAVLAILAAKHALHETYSVIFLPLIWENRQGSTSCWQGKLYHALKASAKALSAHLRHALLRMSRGSQAVLATSYIRPKNQPIEPVWRRSLRFPNAVFMNGCTK